VPHRFASLPPELHIQIVDGVRARRNRLELALELGVHEGTIAKWTRHLPNGTKRDLVLASILERAERGEDVLTIASLENCSVSFVVDILRSAHAERDARERLAGVPPPAPPPPALPDAFDRRLERERRDRSICADYLDPSKSVGEIAAEHGIAAKTVQRIAKRLPARPSGRRSTPHREAIRAAWKEGKSQAQIASELGIKPGVVQWAVRDLPRRRPPVPAEVRARARALYESGQRPKQIATALDLPIGVVRDAARGLHAYRRVLTDQERTAIRDAYLARKSYAEIASAHNVAPQTIAKLTADLPRRRRYASSKP
jgi:transposase-like protein